jgi:hypothetical protein
MCSTGRYLSIGIALSLVLPHSALARQHLVAGEVIAARLQAAALESQRKAECRAVIFQSLRRGGCVRSRC